MSLTDWCVAHLTPRNAALGLLLLFGLPILASRIPWAYRLARHRLLPPKPVAAAVTPPDLKGQLQRQELRGIYSRYRRVNAMLDKAEAEGFAVAGHRAKAKAAVRLAQLGFRWQAQTAMNDVEMNVPRKKVRYIPLYPKAEGAEEEEVAPDAPASRADQAKPAQSKPAAKTKAKPKARPKAKRRR